jgi:hypothetical protein
LQGKYGTSKAAGDKTEKVEPREEQYTILHVPFKKHYLSSELPTMSLEAFFAISVALPVAFSIIEFIPNLSTCYKMR